MRKIRYILLTIMLMMVIMGCSCSIDSRPSGQPEKNDWVVVNVSPSMHRELYDEATVQVIEDEMFETGHVETARAYQKVQVGDRVRVGHENISLTSSYYVILPKEAVESTSSVEETVPVLMRSSVKTKGD